MYWFIGFDALAVTLFAIIGRSGHGEESTIAGVASTAAPFLIALVAARLIVGAWESPLSWPAGIGVRVITAAGGMLLRRFVFDDGTAAGVFVAGSVFQGGVPARMAGADPMDSLRPTGPAPPMPPLSWPISPDVPPRPERESSGRAGTHVETVIAALDQQLPGQVRELTG